MKNIYKIICILFLFGILFISSSKIKNVYASNQINNQQCQIISSTEKHKEGYSINNNYEYDNTGNIIKFSFPNKFDVWKSDMSEAIRSPIYHWVFWQDVPVAYIPTQKITYYDYMKDVIYTGDCQDKDFETCKKDSAVSFKSYFDKNNNKIDLYTKNKNNKNYKIKIYAYDKNGKKLEKWNIDWNNFSEGNIIKYLYDKSNLLTSEFVREYKDKKYYNDKTKKDTVKTEITKTYTKYIYDNKGNIISKKLKCNEKLENCKSQIKYEYDTKGNLIKETADNYTYIYDINGNIIQKYNKTKYSDYYYKYDYDKCNNVLKEYKCNDNWSNCQESIQYKYNYMQ